MTSLGGGSRSGGAPVGQHPIASLSEQGRRSLRLCLGPGEATRPYPKDGMCWLVRGEGPSIPRALSFWLDENGCFQRRLDSQGNSSDSNHLDEQPNHCRRTIYLSSNISQADLTRLAIVTATGDPQLQKEAVTLQDFGAFIHCIAVCIPHANLEVLKGVKNKHVPVLSEIKLAQFLNDSLARNEIWWKQRITRWTVKGKKPPKEVAIDLLIKECELCENWIKFQQCPEHRASPGFAPWLAALGLSYLQASPACHKRLETLVAGGFITRNERGWYTLAKLPKEFSLRREPQKAYSATASVEMETKPSTPESQGSSRVGDSPRIWKTSPSPDGSPPINFTEAAWPVIVPDVSKSTDWTAKNLDTSTNLPMLRDSSPSSSTAGEQVLAKAFLEDWFTNTMRMTPMLEIALVLLKIPPPDTTDEAALWTWLRTACPHAASFCASVMREDLDTARAV